MSCERKLNPERFFCDWTSLEKAFEANRTYKSVVGEPSEEQLELARQEWIDRFMKDDGKDSGVPAVLVATNVPKSWEPCESLNHACLLLTEDGDLFMRKVRTDACGAVSGAVIGNFGIYCHLTQTTKFIGIATAVRKYLTGAMIEPDIVVRPTFSWDSNDNHKARGMIELEHKHRGPSDSLAQGFAFLTASHFHRFYMLIRIFPRHTDRSFGAACVVWRKDPASPSPPMTMASSFPLPDTVHVTPPPPVASSSLLSSAAAAAAAALVGPKRSPPQPPTLAASPLVNAALAVPAIGGILPGVGYDFGTAPLDPVALAAFTAPIPGSFHLPPALFGALLGVWNAANNPAFQVPIPAIDVFYLVPDGVGGLVYPSPALDCGIDLGTVQVHLDKGNPDFLAPMDDL